MRRRYVNPRQYMAFTDRPDRMRLLEEVATRETSGEDLGSYLLSLPDPDPVLRAHGSDAKVLTELASDDQVMMAMTKRKLKTLNRDDYKLEPGAAKGAEPAPEAKRLAADLEADLENLDLRQLFSEILNAPYYGMTVVELLFEPAGKRVRLADAVAKPWRWFSFNARGELLFKSMGSPLGELVEPYKFVLARNEATYENPYGERLMSRCLWPVAFKRGGIEFWTRFCEKFGMPWVIAEGGKDANDRQNMANSLSSMVQDAVAVVPPGYSVRVESFSGKGEVHESFIKHWDAAISKVIMGQTLTAELGDTGSFAASQTHAEGLDDLAKADEALLVAAMNELAWNYARVNAGPDVRAPLFAFVEPQDYAALADLDGKLYGIGVRKNAQGVSETYDLPEEHFYMAHEQTEDDNGENGKTDEPENADQTFAEGRTFTPEQQTVENLVAAVLPDGWAQAGKLEDAILAAAQEAAAADQAEPGSGFVILEQRLAELMRQAPGYEDVLARGMLAMELFGRYSAQEQSDA